VLNPLRSEAEAFQVLVYIVAAIALIAVVVLLIKAIA
jgi:hypothetical protein